MNTPKHVHYFNPKGEYIDHGRMIYKTLPVIGEFVHPFYGIPGKCNWKVIKVEETDRLILIHVEDHGWIEL